MKQKQILTNPIVVTVIAIFCCALWGSATPFIKIGYQLMLPAQDVASTILFAGVRFFLAGVMVILCYSLFRKKLLVPQKENLGRITIVSLFQTVIQYIFFYIGVANTTGVKATVISGSGTFSAILVACFIFHYEKLTIRKLLACVIGFAGIILVNWNGMEWSMNLFGDGFVLFATIAYGVSSSLMKRYSNLEDPVIISGYQFLFGGILMVILGILLGGSIYVNSTSSTLVLGYLAFLSAVAYSLWGVLLKYNPISKVAVFSFMIPVFGVLLSEFLLSESSGVTYARLLISVVLIAVGIILQNNFEKIKGEKP